MQWEADKVRIRASIYGLTLILIVGCSAQRSGNEDAPSQFRQNYGNVFVVLSVDTEPLHAGDDSLQLDIDLSNFATEPDSGYVPRVFSAGWRNQYVDHFGNHPKFTWFVLTSEHIRQTGNNAAVYDALMRFRPDIESLGDEIAWHYHHCDWYGIDNGKKLTERWGQLLTFNGTDYPNGSDIELCERTLNLLISERGFFPASFRAGWCWENNDFSRWLDEVCPFDLSSAPPAKYTAIDGQFPTNVCDWSTAPVQWVPYHPDTSDYQRPGTMKRLISRSLVHRLFQHDLDTLLTYSKLHRLDQVLSLPVHSYSNIRHSLDQILPVLIEFFETNDIPFEFSTCKRAMSHFMTSESQDEALRLRFSREGKTLRLTSIGHAFQSYPYNNRREIKQPTRETGSPPVAGERLGDTN